MNLVENSLVDTVGEDKGGADWESSTDVYTLSCKTDSGKLLNNTALCSVMI